MVAVLLCPALPLLGSSFFGSLAPLLFDPSLASVLGCWLLGLSLLFAGLFLPGLRHAFLAFVVPSRLLLASRLLGPCSSVASDLLAPLWLLSTFLALRPSAPFSSALLGSCAGSLVRLSCGCCVTCWRGGTFWSRDCWSCRGLSTSLPGVVKTDCWRDQLVEDVPWACSELPGPVWPLCSAAWLVS